MTRTLLLLTVVGTLLGCDGESASPERDGAVGSAYDRGRLPERHSVDPDRAEAGRQFLFDEWPGDAVIPREAIEYLWVAWGTGPVDEDRRWQEIERRYGLFRPEGEAIALGLSEADGGYSINCLACHAAEGPDEAVWVGVGNPRLDLQRLYDDLVVLSERAEELGMPAPQPPQQLDGVGGAPGAVDGIGLGMLFAGTIDELGEVFGYQQAPAWWTMRYKDRLYTDGAGRVANWRTMMSTLFSFGWSQERIRSYDDEFKDLRQFVLSLEPPPWPFEMAAPERIERGRALFDERCARCHGSYHGPDPRFPDRVVPTGEIGTDPRREAGMDDRQVAAINGSWYGEPAAWENTDGYLAPPLLGVWATAPYFHNGSVPDLHGVLDSTSRPDRWRLAEDKSYDAERVGWAYITEDGGDGGYDTGHGALDNGGHTHGDDLRAEDRQALLAYLKTL